MTDLQSIATNQAIRVTFPFLLKISPFLPLPAIRAVKAANIRLRSYATQSIRRYKGLLAKNAVNPKRTLFTKLFDAGNEGLPDLDITFESQGMIVAGSDTTAITLTYVVYSLCTRPRLRDKLAKEVAKLPSDFTYKDIKALPYLNQVVQETLRLYSAAPAGLPRSVPPEGAILGGYRFPGGVTVSTQAFSLHRNPDVFIDPLEYVYTHLYFSAYHS
jgi:cytochrome P450